MPIPDATGRCYEPVVENQGLITVSLGDVAQALGPAQGVPNLDAATGVGAVGGLLGLGQGSHEVLFTAAGLAVGPAF